MTMPIDAGMDAIGALLAGSMAEENLDLRALTHRQPKLCARLKKFSFRHVAEILAGLLIRPENHPATLRIEALIHLAALHCRGSKEPTLAQIREWLNEILLKDRLGRGEDPVEDVFSSVVPSWSGCVILLEGAWRDNAHYLQNVMAALLGFGDEGWAKSTMSHVMALLRVADEVTRRAGVERYEMSATAPRNFVKVAPRPVEEGTAAVSFSLQDIFGMGLIARDIAPFATSIEQTSQLGFETLGHTWLERRPLLRHEGGWLVTLPTAIGAAARRFVMERAAAASALNAFQSALQKQDWQCVAKLVLGNLEMSGASESIDIDPRLRASTATFDRGGHALVVLASEDLADTLETGLQGINSFVGETAKSLWAIEEELSSRPDYRRGLTIIVHGGVGRGYAFGLPNSPPGWHRLSIDIGDAVRMSWDGDFTARRLWKLLSQQNQLPSKGFDVVNPNGFLNLYGYLQSQDYHPVPAELVPQGMMMLGTDYVAHARSGIRKALDYHLVLGPSGTTFVEVQRRSTTSYFKEVSGLPLFVAPLDAMNGRFLAVVETHDRPWWIEYDRKGSEKGELAFRIWDAAQRWMIRLAPALERELPNLPRAPVWVRLLFSDHIESFDEGAADSRGVERPTVTMQAGTVCLDHAKLALSSYAQPTNIAERHLISAIALGACELAGTQRSLEWADALAVEITRSEDARFAHAIPVSDVTQMVQSTIPLPAARLPMDEDRGWSHLGLATLAGRSDAGEVPEEESGALLQAAVLCLWERIEKKLRSIDRRSLVVKALLNHEAIDKDRAHWAQTAAALLTLHDDKEDVLRAHNELEGRRASAAVASRALAEMAICTCPTSGASPCGDIDLDEFIADICAMVECAGQCDAHFYGLAVGPLRVLPNGSFLFDSQFVHKLHLPYAHAHGDRAFRDAAADYAEAFQSPALHEPDDPEPQIDPVLEQGMVDEFGLSLAHLVGIAHGAAELALDRREPFVTLRRSEVRTLIADLGPGIDVDKAFWALTLRPRAQWKEDKPEGALARDWQPWRMNRKLSLTRRPLIQIDDADDPEVLIFPVLTARAVRRIFGLIDGHLGSEMFDSKGIDRWIGKIVNERGHAFNHSVAAKLREIGFEAAPDQLMTQFGGDKALGDIDVLAWDRSSGLVWAIECKRLLMDRTVGEIGERLADYTTRGKRKGKRTPIQKHLDRLDFLKDNIPRLAVVTGINEPRIVLRSALVTDRIVPMQFTQAMTTLVDVVCDFRNLDKTFAEKD